MIEYIIGVDGGGSGTRVRLARPDGTELARANGAASSLAHGIEAAWAAIEASVAQAFASAAIARPRHDQLAIGLGLAGASTRHRCPLFLERNPGYAAIVLDTDAYTTLLGAHGGRPGAVVALGTGSVGAVLQADGQRREVGGWAFPAGDEGGAAWMGLLAMNHAQQTLDGRAAPGALSRAVIAACGGGDDALRDWIATAGQSAYATLAALVLEHGAADPAAGVILYDAGLQVAQIAHALDPAGQLPLALCGGLAAPLARYLPHSLRERLSAPTADSAAGALELIRRQVNAAQLKDAPA